MIILAIETTGPKASVALINEDGDISEKTSDEEMNHLKGLVPMIKALIDECGCLASDIQYIAASVGPGSFTGIRIGVATARALAQAWAIQTVSVPTLESFVYNLGGNNIITQSSNDNQNGIALICPIFDARRSQIYSGAYCLKNGKPSALLSGDAWDFEIFSETLAGLLKEQDGKYKKIVFFGDGLSIYDERIQSWTRSFDLGIETVIAADIDRYQKASSVARMAYVLANEGACGHYSSLLPVYMRKAEAERKREELGGSIGVFDNGKT